MFAVHTMISFTPLFSSSSSSTSFSLSHTLNLPFQSSISSLSPSHLYPLISLTKFTRTTNSQQKPLLSLVGLPTFKHSLIQCTTTTSNLYSEMETMFLLLFQDMGINESETESLLNSNPVLRITPFESIRARVVSLQHLGINGFELYRLITKRPDVLTAKEIDPLICFIRDDLESKIEPAQLERLLNSTEPRFLVGFEEKVRLLIQLGIPREKITHVLNNVNLTKSLCLKSVEEIGSKITFLNRFGGVDLIVKRPAILNYDLESQLIPRIGFLKQLSGGDEEATGTVLRKLPAILAYHADHLKDHVEFLRSFAGLSDEEIFRIVLVYPNVFSTSRKRKLHPRIDFLKQCGLNSNDIFRFLIKAPLFLSLSFEGNLAYKLVFLVKIGYENRTKELAMAMGAVTRTSYKNMQEVMGLFLNYGLSCEEILGMSKKHPQILQYNCESLEEKMDYLVEDMGREVGELLAFPAFLGYKLDGRIKHRYEEKKKILGEGMSLNKLLSVSSKSFSMKKKKKNPVLVIDNLNGSG